MSDEIGMMERMKNSLARVVSLVFDPRVEIPLLLILAVLTAYQNGTRLLFLGLLLFVDVVLPLAFYLHLHFKKEISDWDITKREERVPLYVFATLAHLGGVGLAGIFGQIELMKVLGVFWLMALVFTAVTSRWKVSIHAGVNAALATYLGVSGGDGWWYGVIVVLVVWSRVHLKRHGMAQVVVGAMLGGLGVLAGMRVMGL